MVDVTPIQTFDHKVSWEAKVLAYFDSLFIENLGGKVLGDAAVVYVTQFILIVLMVEQIVHIYIVYIALNACQIDSIILS